MKTPSVIGIKKELQGKFLLTNLTISVSGLPKSFEDYKIVQLTDLHYGCATNESHLNQAVEITNNLNPDLILLTGDYIQMTRLGTTHLLADKISPKISDWFNYQSRIKSLAEDLRDILTPLNARDGIYGVFGNHDYLEGIEVISKTLPNNINWITNTSTTITKNDDSLLLLGVDDYNRGNPDLKKTFSNYSDKHFFKILLSHNPDITISKDKDLLNHSNLILAGHTHGGQIKLPKIKPVICRTRQKKHVQSLSHFNSTAVYVSNGVGYGGVPLRVFCPPEIVVINLKPELRKNTESFQEVTQNI